MGSGEATYKHEHPPPKATAQLWPPRSDIRPEVAAGKWYSPLSSEAWFSATYAIAAQF